MLKTIMNKLNIYEKYNKLITEEGKRIFIRTVYTLSVCTVAIIFIWYYGIINLTSKNQKVLIPGGFLQSTVQAVNQKVTLSAKIDGESDTQKASNAKKPDTSKSNAGKSDLGIPAQNKNLSNKESSSEIVKKAEESGGDKSQNVKKTDESGEEKSQNVKKTDESGGEKSQNVKKATVVQKTIYKGTNKSYVALTFDDGYNEKTIIKVLDVLKKNDIKATFFIIGRVLDDYPDVWKRAINEGHQICNHTLNHATLTKLSDQQVKNEIMGWETYVKKVLGEEYLIKMKNEFPYLRLPGGNGNKSDRILSIAQDCGYKVIGWSLETNSSVINPMRNNHSTEEIAKKVEQHVVNDCTGGSIILLHFNQYDITNIEDIVSGIKNKGYSILTVTGLLSKN